MGIAMSITAFPVLVRILRERGLSTTLLGTTAITCAAVDDVTAWGLLAIVVAIAGAGGLGAAALTLVLTLVFIAAMLLVVGPWLARSLAGSVGREEPGKGAIAFVLVFLLASALTTELIGIHALFGAFLAGVVMPRDRRFRAFLSARLEEFPRSSFPLFFVHGAAHPHRPARRRPQLASLRSRHPRRDAPALSASIAAAQPAARSTPLPRLMNTRGLMELIALNVGYELGILSPASSRSWCSWPSSRRSPPGRCFRCGRWRSILSAAPRGCRDAGRSAFVSTARSPSTRRPATFAPLPVWPPGRRRSPRSASIAILRS
jgi:hypothetical protein